MKNSNEKLTLATKMGGSLAPHVPHFNIGARDVELLLLEAGLFGWYLFTFECLRDVDISGLFRFLFLPLTSFHEAFMFIFCVLCVICFTVSVSLALYTYTLDSVLSSIRQVKAIFFW
jgi:hypothetical protein